MVILGSTGSIGTQALDIARRNPERFRVAALAAGGGNPALLASQAVEFGVPVVAVADEAAAPAVPVSVKVTVVSVPLHLWIQATRTLWLGPLFGLQVYSNGGGDRYPLGFGLGTSLTHLVDLRTWILFPDISRNEAARTFGAGVALQLRFG